MARVRRHRSSHAGKSRAVDVPQPRRSELPAASRRRPSQESTGRRRGPAEGRDAAGIALPESTEECTCPARGQASRAGWRGRGRCRAAVLHVGLRRLFAIPAVHADGVGEIEERSRARRSELSAARPPRGVAGGDRRRLECRTKRSVRDCRGSTGTRSSAASRERRRTTETYSRTPSRRSRVGASCARPSGDGGQEGGGGGGGGWAALTLSRTTRLFNLISSRINQSAHMTHSAANPSRRARRDGQRGADAEVSSAIIRFARSERRGRRRAREDEEEGARRRCRPPRGDRRRGGRRDDEKARGLKVIRPR